VTLEGGGDPVSQEKAQKDVADFYRSYLQSPNYKKRLKMQGYTDPNQAISSRLTNLDSLKFVPMERGFGSAYIGKDNEIQVDPMDVEEYGMNALISHEMSHALGATKNSFFKGEMKMNKKEHELIDKKNKLSKYGEWDILDMNGIPLPEPYDEKKVHNGKSQEFKADMDALRYQLYKDKIYNTGKQKFNNKILQKAKEKYKDNHIINRLFERASDKDLIELMNTIASRSNLSQTQV
jgi:hypothetical protein